MVLTVDQQRVKSLIQETITLLCKNGLNYNDEFTIEALIGITIDKDNVFLVTINDSVQSDKPKSPIPPPVQKSPSPKPAAENSYSVHRERKRQRESAQNDTSRDDTNLSYDDDSYRVPGSSNQGYTGNHEDDEPPLNKRPNYSNVKQEKEDSNDSDLVMVKEEPGEGGGGDYNYGAQYSEHSQSSMYNTGAGFSDQWPPGTDAKSMQQQQQFQGASFGGSQAGYSPSPSGGGGGGGQPGQGLSCLECNRSFRSRLGYQQHMDSHRGVFKYKCNFCERGFQSHSHFKGHMLIHTNEQKPKCGFCGKEFSFNHNLIAHMKDKHGEYYQTSHSLDKHGQHYQTSHGQQWVEDASVTHDQTSKSYTNL